MTESELFDEENWFDFGLTDHIETDKFPHWFDVAEEIARIAGCEPDSPLEALFLQCAASASKLGFDCDHCGNISRPLNDDGACPKCAAKMANVELCGVPSGPSERAPG